jgi:hypothetical protein
MLIEDVTKKPKSSTKDGRETISSSHGKKPDS